MVGIFETLKKRGFIDQVTHGDELENYLESNIVTSYVGFDPTASSLHVGNLLPLMALMHMRKMGHKTIALIGGGTGRIGDPSGKTETRKILPELEICKNVIAISTHLKKITTSNVGDTLVVNNADWLSDLKYISFIRDIGRYFSVNKMIKSEGYKNRLDSDDGLTFTEFNYMLLQAYDYYRLYNDYGCKLQIGGRDQWGNIVAGIDLIRRLKGDIAFGLTFPLITTTNGIKMGKTVDGAIWLDSSKTSFYDYYQFWVNISDADLKRFISLFTFLPMNEIEKIAGLGDKELNYAKNILAYEATSIIHGSEKASEAHLSSLKMFGNKDIPLELLPSSNIPRSSINLTESLVPTLIMEKNIFINGIPAFKLFCNVGLTNSNSSARRLIEHGGAYINGVRIKKFDTIIELSDIENFEILLRAGKKRFIKIKVVE